MSFLKKVVNTATKLSPAHLITRKVAPKVLPAISKVSPSAAILNKVAPKVVPAISKVSPSLAILNKLAPKAASISPAAALVQKVAPTAMPGLVKALPNVLHAPSAVTAIQKSNITERATNFLRKAEEAKRAEEARRLAETKQKEDRAFATQLKTFIPQIEAIVANQGLSQFHQEGNSLLNALRAFVAQAGINGIRGLGNAEKAGILDSLKSFISKVSTSAPVQAVKTAVAKVAPRLVAKPAPSPTGVKPAVIQPTVIQVRPVEPAPAPAGGIDTRKMLMIGGAVVAVGAVAYTMSKKKKKKGLNGLKKRKKPIKVTG